MKEKLPKICDVSTSEVQSCEHTDCQFHIKHYESLEDWLIVHPNSANCKEMSTK